MNKEIAIEWVAELRSGKYQQTVGYLQNDKGLCCLGVLCELAVAADVIPPSTVRDPGSFGDIHRYGEQDATAMPPTEVNEWAGIGPWEDYEVPTPDKFRDKISERINSYSVEGEPRLEVPEKVGLTALNDVYGATFSDIADAIESQWVLV